MTSSDRCSLYLHRFGAFEMSLSNTLWKWCVQVIHPNAIICFWLFFFSILCQCNVYWTWCSIKCVNRVACNFVCVLHFRWEHARGSSRLALCSVIGTLGIVSGVGLASFHTRALLAATHWADKYAHNLSDISTGHIRIISNDEKEGYICWAAEKSRI